MNNYVRVTEVLSVIIEPQYEAFKKNVNIEKYNDTMENKRKEGELLHRFFSEILILGDISKEDKKAYKQYAKPIKLLKEWIKKNIEKVEFSEIRYTNTLYWITGQLDAIVYFKGRSLPSIIDLKCTSVITKKAPLQVAGGYTLISYPCKYDSAGVLQIKKIDGGKEWALTYKEWNKKEFPKWQGLFLQALSLYKYLCDNKGKNNGNKEEDC